MLEDLVSGLLFTRTRVREVEDIGPHFRRVAVESETAGALRYRAGDKVQVRVGGWKLRTFTPFTLAAAPELVQLLVFHHAPSPAGIWARSLAVGDLLELFGPRKSIVLEEIGGATLFGDETSIAAALSTTRSVLETDHESEVREVLARFGATGVTLVPRRHGDEHLRELGERLRAEAEPLVLTGRAQSIQSMRSHLGAERKRIAKTKAYWSVGRSGLD